MQPGRAPLTATQIADQYFDAFSKGDINTIVQLFSPDGKVKSSSGGYAEVDPKSFYEKVLGLTADKTIAVHSVALDRDDRNIAIVHFGYDWTLRDGSRKNFPNAFDKFEIDPRLGKIKSLTIYLGTDVLA